MPHELDVSPTASADHRKAPAHGPHPIQVGDDMLHFREVLIAERTPTAVQILEQAKLHPAEEYLLFRMLRSGLLKELRPDERTDLVDDELERFLAFRSDRTYRFEINGRTFDWGATFISGHTLKVLADLDPETHDVWLKVHGGQDRLIEDGELFDLSAPGIEHFVTTKRKFKIIVNGRERVVEEPKLSFVEIGRAHV